MTTPTSQTPETVATCGNERLSRDLHIWLTDEDRQKVAAAAKAWGMSSAGVLRHLVKSLPDPKEIPHAE